MKHIKKVDGLSGCYRGLSPKIIGSIVGAIGSRRVAEKFGLDEFDENESKDESDLTEEERYKSLLVFCISLVVVSYFRTFHFHFNAAMNVF